MLRLLAVSFGMILAGLLYAQPIEKVDVRADTAGSVKSLLRRSNLHIHARTFAMGTVNQQELTDYYAFAMGAGMGFESARLYGLSFGMSGWAMANVASSDLNAQDSLSRGFNRYELGLFDITDPTNRFRLYRLEDFYARYHISRTQATVGKFSLKSPFINPQDGRMRPTMVEGVWLETDDIPWLHVEGGWLWRISPRGTVQWYSVATSVGLLPQGVMENGIRSNYANNIQSKGMAIASVHIIPSKNHRTQLWNYTMENVFNTFQIQHDSKFDVGKKQHVLLGIQYTRQDKLNCGGNCDSSKTYFTSANGVNVLSARVEYGWSPMFVNVNYTRILNTGRFLMPREWGRESFYTFLPRERNEGAGDVHAITSNVGLRLPKHRFTADAGYGYYRMPEVSSPALNKYAMPSYHQLNIQATYHFNGFLDGLNLQFLYVFKHAVESEPMEYKYVFNKVNLHHFNMVINYNFATRK